MSFFPCCSPVGQGVPVDVVHTIINIGGAAEWYVGTTGPNPFEFRTAESSDGSIAISTGVSTVDFIVDFAGNVSNLNVGGFAEWFRAGTSNPFEFRTAQSSDASVTITQNANDIDFVVASSAGWKVFQVDSTATILTNSSSFVTFVTLAGDAKVLDTSIWKINMCVLICVPDSVFVNAEQRWQIETAAGVFTTFDQYSTFQEITLESGEFSTPYHRTKKLTASMDAPRMRLQVRRRNPGSTDFYWELPRWGGAMITEAP